MRALVCTKNHESPDLGWANLAIGGVEVHIVQANHVALLVKPHVETLAKELKDCLNDESNLPCV